MNKKLKKFESREPRLTDYQLKIFDELKKRLASPTILALPRVEKRFVLVTDGNAKQLGYFLLQ